MSKTTFISILIKKTFKNFHSKLLIKVFLIEAVAPLACYAVLSAEDQSV